MSFRWLNGPEFLWKSNESWPTFRAYGDLSGDPEVSRVVGHSAVSKIDNSCIFYCFVCYFSSWHRLLRASAWLLIFIRFLGCTGDQKKNFKWGITVELLDVVKVKILLFCQRRNFPVELENLKKNYMVSMNSPLKYFRPILDHSGLIRVGGRLINAEAMNYNEKHPVIIPNKSHVAKLIIREAHEKLGHAGRMHVLSEIRSEFWILKGNSSVRSVLSKCVACKKNRGRVQQQLMADLPADRISRDLPPFCNTGMDYFGPFFVKRGRTRVKRWGVIFTCLSMRAVHLEMAYDLSSDAFINVFRRFLARRGNVSKIRSDRGTNIVGGSNELSQILNQQKISDELLKKKIEFEFNPPNASHFGGVWERMILSVRRTMEALAKLQDMDDDGFNTLLCEVECILNSRPLTCVSSDSLDLRPVSPNTLLNIGDVPISMEDFTRESSYSRRRYRQVQYMAQQFWIRWQKEYMCILQRRQKWQKETRNLKPNDIVLVVDPSAARCHWSLARVLEVKYSKDGLVRSVVIKVGSSGKKLERPVSKLVLILEDEDDLIN